MAKNSKKRFLLDTSAFISLESINLLERVISVFDIETTNSVIDELKDFSKHSDEYGNTANRILKIVTNVSIDSTNVNEQIKYLEKTDNELFNLSKEKKISLITDDHKLIHHTKDKIEVYFSTFFLVTFAAANVISKREAMEMLEKLRDIRNWESNIIYLTTKETLDGI